MKCDVCGFPTPVQPCGNCAAQVARVKVQQVRPASRSTVEHAIRRTAGELFARHGTGQKYKALEAWIGVSNGVGWGRW